MSEASSTEAPVDDDEDAPETPQEPRSDDETSDEEAEADEHEHEQQEPAEPSEAASERESQKAIDKKFDAFTREAMRHAKRVAEIGEEDAQSFLQCPMCAPDEGQPEIPGWLLPVAPSDAKVANVRTAIGLAAKVDYREDPFSKACPTCGGLRSVVPAGMDAASLTLPCVTCKAQGWVPVGAERGGVATNGEASPAFTVTPPPVPSLEPDSPEVAALKAQGYTVIAPMAPFAS